jgi:hypothetical protein
MKDTTYRGKWIYQTKKDVFTGQVQKRRFKVIVGDKKAYRIVEDISPKKIRRVEKL